jgi:hypothetical protein
MDSDEKLLLLNQIVNMLHYEAVNAMKSNEYNFNDTAVRAKTLFYASELVKDLT